MTADKPWLAEPKQVDLIDDATGLPIALRRGPSGHWCGYVGVPSGHPWHKVDYDCQRPVPTHVSPEEPGIIKLFVSPSSVVDCHGGLTFSGEIEDNAAANWWLGFDCAHCGDLCPNNIDPFRSSEVYRDVAFVTAEARKLAKGIAAVANLNAARDAGLRERG